MLLGGEGEGREGGRTLVTLAVRQKITAKPQSFGSAAMVR